MHTTLIGLFDSYRDAEAATEDLESAGMVGEQVEVISDVDRDLRAENLGFKPHEGIRERIARAFDRLRGRDPKEVHDDSGDQPEFIGEQEFYATHVKAEGAVIVVRVPSEALADTAEGILKEHGSKTREGKKGALRCTNDDRPRSRSAQGRT